MHPTILLIFYSIAIVASSLIGGILPSLFHLTHTRMQLIVSFVGGLMLGVGVLHLLPHGALAIRAQNPDGYLDRAVLWMVIGLLAMFFLIRVFHFHQHAAAESDGHEHSDEKHHHHVPPSLGWIGVAAGLSIHTMIDGLALAAGVWSEWGHDVWLPGFSIFLVIILHKPLDALSITSLMQAGNWKLAARQIVNASFAMMCPLGALMFAMGVGIDQMGIIGRALAFSSGVFVCISLGDLLPEVHFHSHDRIKLSAALLLGIALAYGVGFLEHGHSHGDFMSPAHDHSRNE